MNDTQLSKRPAYLLRHAPHEAGLTLEPGGWVPLAPVLAHLRVRREDVERVVAGSDKGRFALQGERIRANQGHSVPVDLHLTPLAPPATLYHGTHPGALDAIRAGGLRPMNRHHVHLSADPATARTVGARRGPPRDPDCGRRRPARRRARLLPFGERRVAHGARAARVPALPGSLKA